MDNFAYIHAQKHKSTSSVSGIGDHMNRAIPTDNADPKKWSNNMSWNPTDGLQSWAVSAPKINFQVIELKRRIALFEANGGNIQKKAVLAIELLSTASQAAFNRNKFDLTKWAEAHVRFMQDYFGAENIIDLVVHLDESTPHIHTLIFPEFFAQETRGRKSSDISTKMPRPVKPHLAACRWLDGPALLSKLQTSYAKAMKPFGLIRGQEKSTASHELIKKHYGAIRRLENLENGLSRTFVNAVNQIPEPRFTSWRTDSAELKKKKADLARLAQRIASAIADHERKQHQLQLLLKTRTAQYEGLKITIGGDTASDALLLRTAELKSIENKLNTAQEEIIQLNLQNDSLAKDFKELNSYANSLEAEIDNLNFDLETAPNLPYLGPK